MESSVAEPVGEVKPPKETWSAERRAAQSARAKALTERNRLAKEAEREAASVPLAAVEEAASWPGLVDEVPVQLREMRHVASRAGKEDKTHGERECRKWMNKDRRGFMAAKTKLEEALLKSRAGSTGKESLTVGEDVGETAALELVERLLAGFKAGGVE